MRIREGISFPMTENLVKERKSIDHRYERTHNWRRCNNWPFLAA